MKHRLIQILVALFLCVPALAMASGPLPDTTPSGILVDRVLPMAHLEELDGTPAASLVSLPRWRQAVHELSRASEIPLTWPNPRALGQEASPREIPLAVLWVGYDRLMESGKSRAAEVFAFTPLREYSFYGQDQVFSLSPDHILVHGTEPVIRWVFDADDGLGWRDLVPGKPLNVSYPGTGSKILRMVAELKDGRLLHGSAHLNVKRLLTPDPTETWTVTATESYQGVAASGQAYLYLADGHTAPTNPVVVVEGFDLDNTMNWPVLYDLLNQENMLEEIRAAGFDAVVLDFTEATEPIQRNAFVLTELLDQVQTAAGAETPVTLVGASMGGLVSRYGLLWMENQGLDHNVRTFISFDSPQTGANIPLGLQHWLDFFKGESADANFLLSRLDTPAARQMLLYHLNDPTPSSPSPDPMLDSFQADLASLGDWPLAPRLVAVANGSGLGADQGFGPGEQIIRYEYRSLLVDIDGNVWAVPDQNTQVIFDGMLNLIWPLPDTYQTSTVSGTLPWDNAPGGSRQSMAQMDNTAAPYGDIVALHNAHCFIPTISALALDVADPFFDIAGTADLLDYSPFDAVYYPAANQGHIAVTVENKAWIMAELQSGLTPVEDFPSPEMTGLVLYPAAPNPFNPKTEISFRLAEKSAVVLQVHDLSGRVVRTLISGEIREPGRHAVAWSGVDDTGQTLASGVYLYSLQVGDQVRTNRLTLLK
jgi:FlgD Ig-like domain/Lecithin:cholesterol acyltransferase